ncbi:MAG: lactate racemase domain-containing protein [Ignisphaera sp.]
MFQYIRIVYESDIVIGIGSIIPHPVAGCGGDAKIILPWSLL